MPTFEQIITAEFDFAAMKEFLFKVYTHPYVDGAIQKILSFADSISPLIWAGMLLAIALVLSNFGKKILALPLVIGISVIGFLGGAVIIAPRLSAFISTISILDFLTIDPVVIGIIVAAIAAILFLPLYFVGYAAVFGYFTYLLVYPVCAAVFDTTTAMIIGLGAAITVVVVAYIFRKWVEMAGTAIVGGYIAMWALNALFLLPAIANYAIWVAFAAEGLIVQIKTRRRY